MRRILLIFIINLISMSVIAQSLDSHRWKNRIVLIFHTTETTETFDQQTEILQSDIDALKERDIVVYSIGSNELLKNFDEKIEGKVLAWKRKWRVNESFAFLLIGKDGGVKMRETAIVSLQKLNSKIDAMPMRQSEMRKNKY
ncbi:MAG: DUF4174 domain-containing protein [Bacteroidota bacterium]